MSKGNKTRNRDHAAVALASGKTVADAAVAAGIVERTVYAWLTDPTFMSRVDQLRDEMTRLAVGRLSAAMGDAADVLRELLKSETESIRLRAADRILEIGLKLIETRELQDRIAKLESRGASR